MDNILYFNNEELMYMNEMFKLFLNEFENKTGFGNEVIDGIKTTNINSEKFINDLRLITNNFPLICKVMENNDLNLHLTIGAYYYVTSGSFMFHEGLNIIDSKMLKEHHLNNNITQDEMYYKLFDKIVPQSFVIKNMFNKDNNINDILNKNE